MGQAQLSSSAFRIINTISVLVLLYLGGGDAFCQTRTLAPNLPPQRPPFNSRVPIYASEFATNPALTAWPEQTILFDLTPTDAKAPVVRYYFDEATRRFCLDEDEDYLDGMVLEDASGKPVLTIPSAEPNSSCAQGFLSAGVYTMRISHKPAPAEPRRVVFASTMSVSPSLTSGTHVPAVPVKGSSVPNPVGGFWAVRPSPDYDSQHRPGRMTALARLPSGIGACYPAARPIVFDFASTQIDGHSLFQFDFSSKQKFNGIDANGLPLLFAPADTYLDPISSEPLHLPDQNRVLIANGSFQPCSNPYFGTAPWLYFAPQYVADLGSYHFRWGIAAGFLDPGFFTSAKTDYSDHTVVLDTFSPGQDPSNYQAAQLQVLFRFFPDASKVEPLQPGEVALFQSCDYGGKASVFAADIASLATLNSSAVTLDKTAASIKLGPGTSVRLYSGEHYTGNAQEITADTSCLPGVPNTRSFEILPTPMIKLSSHRCPRCQLQGIDARLLTSNLELAGANLSGANFAGTTFSGLDLAGADLSFASFAGASFTSLDVHGANLSWADLSGTKFPGANFANANLNGSIISCATDFSGTADSPLDLTGADFAGAQLPQPAGSCRTNFSHTVLSATTLPLSQLRFVNLTGAQFLGLQGYLLSSQAKPLNLSGAMLQGAALQNAILDYAQGLAGADLQQTNFSKASLQNADLSNAQLQGATLDRANLTGANLYGALLSNDILGKVDSAATAVQAHLKNVNLSYATLSGVDFSYANFYGTTPAGQNTCTTTKDNHQGFTKNCASAHGATMTDTHFPDAYLFGVDFTDATMRGVDFSRAILIGANLDATLGTDPNSGTRTSLFRSFLQGANLGSATLSNAVTASGAFVDFRPSGNIVYVYLNGLNHNQFACQGASCNPPTGADVCVEIFYFQPTTVPATNLMPCPDGSTNTNGCGNPDASGHWQSPLLKSATSIVPLFWYDDPVKKPPTFLPAWQNSQSGRVIERCNGIASTFGW